jgi:hypothetical protein
MTTKIYHGNLTAKTLAQAISTRFTDEDLLARYTHSDNQYMVTIASRRNAQSGGKTSIGVVL